MTKGGAVGAADAAGDTDAEEAGETDLFPEGHLNLEDDDGGYHEEHKVKHLEGKTWSACFPW